MRPTSCMTKDKDTNKFRIHKEKLFNRLETPSPLGGRALRRLGKRRMGRRIGGAKGTGRAKRAKGTRWTRATRWTNGLQVLAFGGAAHGVFDEGPEVGVAESIREEGAEAAAAALGGGYALGQALFLAIGEYLDSVFVFGAVVVEVLVPTQGQDAVLDGDFGEGYHGDGTYGQSHVFQ